MTSLTQNLNGLSSQAAFLWLRLLQCR